MPINGKPAVSYILDELLLQGFSRFVFVVGINKELLIDYVSTVYGSRAEISFVEPDKIEGLAYSIYAAHNAATSKDVLVILGDTIFRYNIDLSSSFALYSAVPDTGRWCTIERNDGIITKYHDKKNIPGEKFDALIGVYYFTDREFFFSCTKDVIEKGIRMNDGFQISSVMELYSRKHQIKAIEAAEWHDCGSIDNFYRTRKELISVRKFNSLKFNYDFNTITKESRNEEFVNEVLWYVSLPPKLKAFVPAIIEYSTDYTKPFITMEYCGHTTLAELYMYYDIKPDIWKWIFSRLFGLVGLFGQYNAEMRPSDFMEMYIIKTDKRLRDMEVMIPGLLTQKTIKVNGKLLYNYSALREKIEKFSMKLFMPKDIQIIHGDFNFSNILYDINSGSIKLVDPRGSFGKMPSIYGDIKYDLAKLRHSLSGYEFIINDIFTVESKDDMTEINYTIYKNKNHKEIADLFDAMLFERYDIQQIKFIEGLLFLSMTPLHSDSRKRQMVMYAKGLELLNEVLI
jgi:dTDP-glucose pyrophosphorylase